MMSHAGLGKETAQKLNILGKKEQLILKLLQNKLIKSHITKIPHETMNFFPLTKFDKLLNAFIIGIECFVRLLILRSIQCQILECDTYILCVISGI